MRAKTLGRLRVWPALVQSADRGNGGSISNMLFGSEGFLESAKAVSSPLGNTVQVQDDVGLFSLQPQVGPNILQDVLGHSARYRPLPRLLACWANFLLLIDIATKFFIEPIQETMVSVADLKRGGNVDFPSHSQANTAFTVNDASQVSEVSIFHAFIIPQLAEQGNH